VLLYYPVSKGGELIDAADEAEHVGGIPPVLAPFDSIDLSRTCGWRNWDCSAG
jgi:hypothetical protein